jgi:hypothetical protein
VENKEFVSSLIMPSDANLKAAQQVVYSRALAQRGRSRDTSGGIKPLLSIRAADKNNAGSNKSSVARIIKLLEAADASDPADVAFPTMGRPRMLTDEKDEAIVAFVIWMERAGLPTCRCEIEGATNMLRQCWIGTRVVSYCFI